MNFISPVLKYRFFSERRNYRGIKLLSMIVTLCSCSLATAAPTGAITPYALSTSGGVDGTDSDVNVQIASDEASTWIAV